MKTRPVLASWAFEARLVCTVQLYISVRGDSTLMGNYTTITSSLIKQRATRLIQPCDPAVRAHSSLHSSDIIQSVLQRRTANWRCCYVPGSVSQPESGLPLQSHVTPSNYSLMFPTLCLLTKCKYLKILLSLILRSAKQKVRFKMENLASEKWTPATKSKII